MKTSSYIQLSAVLVALSIGTDIVNGQTVPDAREISVEDQIVATSAIENVGLNFGSRDDGACDGDLGCSDNCPCCDDCWLGYRGCGSGGLYVQAEAILAAYHRQDGVKVGSFNSEYVTVGWDLIPRLTVGYHNCEGTGVRMRWFEYNHNQVAQSGRASEFISVDTFNLDFELYDRITLNRNWTVELSGGARFNNFEEAMHDDADLRNNVFHGSGAIFGLEATREFCNGNLYGRFRGAVVMGSKFRSNDGDLGRFDDHVTSMWEIAVGWERTWCLSNGGIGFMRLGGELQTWENFSSEFGGLANGPNGQNENVWGGHSDVGFALITLGVGIEK